MISQGTTTQLPRKPWFVVAGSGIAQSMGAQPLILSTFSLFILPLAHETGWKRTAILATFSACAAGLALGTPIIGRLLDKFAVRPIVITAWLLYCASVALIAMMPHKLPIFYLPYFLTGLFASGTLIPFTKAVLSWFDNKRGAAVGVMAALQGLGTTFTPLLASFLIGFAGYRDAYLWMAGFAVVVGMAMIVPFVHERGVRGGLRAGAHRERDTPGAELPGLTIGKAVSTRHFWMIAFALCVAGICVVGFQANLVPIMAGRGIPRGQATIALSVLGFTSLLGRFGGILLDRFHGTLVGGAVLFLGAVGIGVLAKYTSLDAALTGCALIGLSIGMEIDLLAFLTSRYFGMRSFGTLLGILQGSVILCIALGPLLIGMTYDAVGSYDTIMPFLSAALALCGITVMLLGPYRYPAIDGFDSMAAHDEFSASERLSQIAEQEDRDAAKARHRRAAPDPQPIVASTRR